MDVVVEYGRSRRYFARLDEGRTLYFEDGAVSMAGCMGRVYGADWRPMSAIAEVPCGGLVDLLLSSGKVRRDFAVARGLEIKHRVRPVQDVPADATHWRRVFLCD